MGKPEQGLSADFCPTALWATVLGNIIANPDETTNVGSVFSMFYPCKTSCGMESFAIEAMQSIVEAVEVERGVKNWRIFFSKKNMIPARIEQATFCVLSRCDNHYTT